MRTERTNLLYSRSDLLPIVDGFAAPEIVESAASPTEVMGKGGRALQDEDEVEGEGGMSESRSSWRESGPGRLTHPRGVPNLTTGTFAVSLRLIPARQGKERKGKGREGRGGEERRREERRGRRFKLNHGERGRGEEGEQQWTGPVDGRRMSSGAADV
ncbi:hypothetical protein MPTK1_8g03930 [Marchantia polymorpha subsp. ruderalis]|uniref:Uncharacterized protein n=1 Tax=Marchantia polymorpha TaxID=3197 RepID=A0A2R6XJH3_MARPO|nr:hypothetical protein MARPO_0012s0183 [Marchantia polymorpha]BBN18609.1 hypothetical protein Mp_8g03930 [Marchantia polymorpha subsp. ruderalis]|eukprot:PTQ46255.1 hypothetical protein MARPO_0012s0183 [Marchantia polymorpha]